MVISGEAIGHGQAVVSVLSALRAANYKRKSIVIQNLGPGTLYVGAAGVSPSTGLQVPMNTAFTLDVSPAAAIFVTNSGGNCDVRYIEELLY